MSAMLHPVTVNWKIIVRKENPSIAICYNLIRYFCNIFSLSYLVTGIRIYFAAQIIYDLLSSVKIAIIFNRNHFPVHSICMLACFNGILDAVRNRSLPRPPKPVDEKKSSSGRYSPVPNPTPLISQPAILQL